MAQLPPLPRVVSGVAAVVGANEPLHSAFLGASPRSVAHAEEDRQALARRHGLTGACSRRAEVVPSSARALRPFRTKRNVGWCGRGLESPQLMRKSLGSSTQLL
jgi:hypothetical protein